LAIFNKVREGKIAVINEEHGNALVRSSDGGFRDFTFEPEVSFEDLFYTNDHDARLSLACDTYVQLILGAGLKIKTQNVKAKKKIEKWLNVTQFERKLEDATHSLVVTGNAIFEKFPMYADLIEVDITTIKEIIRDDHGKILEYVQEVDGIKNILKPKDICHFKLSNRHREVWGRGLFQSVASRRVIDGVYEPSPIESMWKVENAMVKIFESYASPMMLIHFADAGEQFIEKQADAFKKAKPGAKILTDKEFDVKVFEVNPASKFDKYIEHLQQDVIEVGSQFPLQMFNAGFTARASSETTDSVVLRKIKRIQRRLSEQIKQEIIDPMLKASKIDPDKADISIIFETESKFELSADDIQKLFEKGTITRDEVRGYLKKNTIIDLDDEKDGDQPPITSVTPTNDLQNQPIPTEFDEKLEEIKGLVKEKIPKPRGRPKKV